jgi:hypothetical protein
MSRSPDPLRRNQCTQLIQLFLLGKICERA